ncbi:MAG: DEAD/DEAH box helicase [Pirellulaceae bacterium]
MSFASLELSQKLLDAVSKEGYEIATPIQKEAIPPILAGADLLGCAQTGTGKTAAFALPTLQRLAQGSVPPRGRRIRCLVLAPTRELASQIAESFRVYGRFTNLRQTVIYGGVGQSPQVKALQYGTDIVVATPGRLLDLMQQGYVDLRNVEILILDEADQMFDMGFIHDLKRIVAKVPRERQTLMFSATMPREIQNLAEQWLRNPVKVSVVPQGTTVERVEQSVYFVEKRKKPDLLIHFLKEQGAKRTLVFMKTKHGADKLVKVLGQRGVRAEAIHGNKSQAQRQRALAEFKSERLPVLVATDIAARGLDIDGVSHVVNFDLPMTPESYVHRIGRTARAGAEGIAVTFCDREELSMLREIERLTRQRIATAKTTGEFAVTDQEDNRPSAAPERETRHGGAPRHQQPYGHNNSRGRRPTDAGKPRVALVARSSEERLAYGSKRFSKKPRQFQK